MPVANEIILASAGSGKTYRLSNRIVKLLAEGVPPAEILALTFTRKAAGEFARRTLTKLADVASDEAGARKLAEELHLDAGKADAAFFGELLEKTVRALHRLRLGTLDSFYQSLVRTHFFELGLSGTFTLLDERLAESERLRVIGKIFRRDAAGEDNFSEFLEAFKLATFGNEERGVSKLMSDFIREAFSLYQLFNDNAIWGNPEKLWGVSGCPWLPTPGEDEFSGALAGLRDFAGKTTFGDKRIAGAISKFIDAAEAWQPGIPLTELGSFFLTKILPEAREFIRAGNAGFKIFYYKKEVEFPAPATHDVTTILRRIIGESLLRRVRMTAGVYALLRQYDAVYDASVRRAGKLTFADMPALLAQSEITASDIGLRLDATVKHWLFDEFQDTSRHDWNVVANNVDEILRDTTGERSAFFVGDVKQALYGWRGGAHALLPEIRDTYALPETELHATYRSCPEVVALVNAVFDNLAGAGGTLPATALANWKKVWHSHESAGGAKNISGYAAWCICEKVGDAEENKMRRLDVIAGLLAQARFLEKNLTCGLLAQTNDEAREAAEFLRARGFRVVSETDTAVVGDSPFILALLAAIEFSAHPENGYAAGTLAMLPALSAWRDALGGDEAMRLRVLNFVAFSGFEKTFRAVAAEAGGASPEDVFLKKRLEQLFILAREFDNSGSRNIDDFLRFARKSTRREIGAGDCVQVMTIHKAKGLEFDVVFLPFLEGDALAGARKESFIKSEIAGEPWILSAPENAICEQTPTLAENLAARKSEACYENFCKLYVALTRAKSATYVITTAAGEKDFEDANFPRLLDATLGNKAAPGFSDSHVIAWESGARPV